METWVIISLVVLFIIIIGLIVYYISKNNNKVSQGTILVPDVKSKIDIEESSSDLVENKLIEKVDFKSIPEEITKDTKVVSSLSISSKTENDLLKKLELFEKNKGFIKKDVNLATLSKQFETNTKYLSEIIKIHRQKPFNSYLNELRVYYIVNRIKNEPKYINTKVSYLASDCGFTSHSTFTTIFTQIMNESPSVFLKRIKEEQKRI
ncbi:AraC family transcriptional regulator [Empedobacter tilapiae]|uniref:Helix-turn-helix domain-containing protein n=1 Tax=Empedobacter tilapiae TaxID=2491114 RepID=A0A4Z1B6S0_9FLAO|nr:helix-turn-helix domain-containing protein [Empedobacter tilapiae]TGN26826.1 helix-turn-helix domain-containing protein [Empedobacter tilapiae]